MAPHIACSRGANNGCGRLSQDARALLREQWVRPRPIAWKGGAAAHALTGGLTVPTGRGCPQRPISQRKKPVSLYEKQASDDGGGEEEDRTPDLRIANATLSQLSYPPTRSVASISVALAALSACTGECGVDHEAFAVAFFWGVGVGERVEVGQFVACLSFELSGMVDLLASASFGSALVACAGGLGL